MEVWRNVHSTSANHFFAQVAGAPCMRFHGQGVASEGVRFDHVAGQGAEHGADWCGGRHCDLKSRCLVGLSVDLVVQGTDWSVDVPNVWSIV
jgi:hypothetical protein